MIQVVMEAHRCGLRIWVKTVLFAMALLSARTARSWPFDNEQPGYSTMEVVGDSAAHEQLKDSISLDVQVGGIPSPTPS